jgi:integrase
MAIWKKKSGKRPYVARVYLSSKNGVPIQKSKSFERQKDALEWIAKYSAFKNSTIDRTVSDKVLFPHVFNAFIEKISVTKKDNTIKSYKSVFNKWLAPELDFIPIGKITQSTILRFFSAIRGKGASDYLVNYAHILLDQVFKFAVNTTDRYIISNPMLGLDKPALDYSPTSSVKFWAKKDADKFLSAAIGSEWYLTFALFLNSGIRTSEAAGITESDFDLERGTLRVSGQITNYVSKGSEQVPKGALFCLSSTKNKETREVQLNPKAFEAARLLIERNKKTGNYFLVHPERKTKTHEIIIKRGHKTQTVKAQIITSKTLGNAVKKYSELAGVANIGPHGLRHTFAANYLMNGGDLFTLSRILGHRNITSTQIYSHLTSGYLKSAMNIVEFGG